MSDEDQLSEARESFEECAQAEAENRKDALDDLRFARLGEQWPEAVRKQREQEGRPCLTINRLPSYIRQVVNDARQNKPSIKVKPVDDSGDVETAEVLNGLIRNIEHISGADVAYDTAVDFAVSCGIGYMRVDMEYAHDDTFDMDVRILRVANPFSIYGDPSSEQADSSDWMRAFIVRDLTRDEFKRKYKGAEPVDFEALGYTALKSDWATDETVRVAEWWTREEVARKLVQLSDGSILDAKQYQASKVVFDAYGLTVKGERESKSWKVRQRVITGAEVLETNDWPGIYIPIVPVYGDEVNVEGKRTFRSLVRDAKDPQRMLNYWRTTGTELVALAPRVPFIGRKGAFATDAAKWATANSVSHPYIEFDGAEPPQRQPLDSGGAAGAMQEALTAADDLKSIMGLFDASLGARSNETSGRAIMARQREGDTSTFHFIDNMSRAIRHLGRVVVDLIPHVYTGPRVLRVIGEDGQAGTVKVGKPTVGEESPEQERAEAQAAVSRIYDLTAGRYDVVVEAGPNFTTRREEAAQQMTEFVRAFPQAAPILGDLLAKNMDWPGAEEISQRLRAMLPPPVQGQDPMVQQMQQQMAQMQQQLQAAMQDKSIDARKLDIDAYNAETNRLKATSAALQPEQVQMLVMQTMQQLLASPDVLPGPPGAAPPGNQPNPQQPPQGGFFMPGNGPSPTAPE